MQGDHALDPIIAHTMRARALQHSGHAAEAWKAIEPLLPTQYGGAMTRAVYIKSEQGDAEAALDLASRPSTTATSHRPEPRRAGSHIALARGPF